MNTKFDELKIVEMYSRGLNTKQIAEIFNTYNTTIRRILVRHNVKLITTGERLRLVQNNPFKSSEEYSDYFLGMLIADGCIHKNTITLGLKEEDIYMLDKFAKFCSPNLNVYKYFHTAHQKFQYQVSFRHQEICNWLQTKANFINKSLECEIYIPLNRNILRGLSDGDGCFFTVNKTKNLGWDFANGSRLFCLQIMDFLKENGINSSLSYNHCWHIKVYKDSYKLGNLIYHNSNLFLQRKYDIWAGCVEMHRKINHLNSGNVLEHQS